MGLDNRLEESARGLFIAVVLGLLAVLIEEITSLSILDPLLVALVFGISVNSLFNITQQYRQEFSMAPSILIPVGVIFYGAANLRFTKIHDVSPQQILLSIMVFLIYIIVILILSSLLRVKEKTSYLIVAGSAICGASAIAITSKSIDAEPEDISLSLIPVFLAALICLFIVLPVVTYIFNLTTLQYGVMSGAILQFTGFVKASVAQLPEKIQNIALSVKAIRYMGLLFLIPLFSSISRRKFYIPFYLYAFLGAGILFSILPVSITEPVMPYCKIIFKLLWSMAMAAIGLNAKWNTLFTRNGLRSFLISFIACSLAVGVFLTGLIIGG
jgi:uncharacterized integral membrane protein (TIGR00698 family)